MTLFNPESIERKTLLILKILSESKEPIGSRVISRKMMEKGISLSERTVRYHLRLLDEKGLTELKGRRDGRAITAQGLEEIKNALVRDKIGFAITRIEGLAFRTTFDPVKREGLLPINISLFRKQDFPVALEAMLPAFKAGLSVSDLVVRAEEGEQIGGTIIPEGFVGLATICSIVVNGVLLKNGVPMDSRFGGILQLKKGVPLRFAELIYYNGSSIDPSEAFIRARMTQITNVVTQGDGKILANYREIPGVCSELTKTIISRLRDARINSLLAMGEISEPVCQIPIELNKVGMILLGGLNPIAAAEEAGINAEHHAMATVVDYGRLVPVTKLNCL